MELFSVDKIDVRSLKVYIDPKTTTKVDELNNLMKYESQHFRCNATLEIDDSFADRSWTLGLIQACDNMFLENRYGTHGSSFWEFHPLKSKRHTMVNDSDGRQYPFYSLLTSRVEINRGTINKTQVKLHYEDHFFPTVAWKLPYYNKVFLTEVVRRQDFWVWLVAIKRGSQKSSKMDKFNYYNDQIYILKTMRWKYNLSLEFDPYLPYGQRLRSICDTQEEDPYILDTNTQIPLSALSAPHCNAAQSLIWYPNHLKDKPKLLVPPKISIVPWNTWNLDMTYGKGFNNKKNENFQVVGQWEIDSLIGQEI